MTRTQKLSIEIQNIYLRNKIAISALDRRGPNGGTNANNIMGWTRSPSGTVTKAANMTDLPVLNLWDGSAPTPSSAIPECVYADIVRVYNKIFNDCLSTEF
jgi:hypothetical protein